MLAQALNRVSDYENAIAFAVASASVGLAVSLFYSPVPFVLLVVVPVLLIFFLSRPYELLLVMVFLIPFNFVFTVGSIPLAVELMKLFLWIPFLFHRGVTHFTASRYNKWLAVLGGIIVLNLLRSHDLPYTLKESIRQGSNIGLCYLAINLVNSRAKVLQVFRVLTVSTFVVACYGFYQFAIQDYGALFWIVNPRLTTSLAHYRDEFWPWRDRMISVLTSEMELGHYFNMCIPVAVALWLSQTRRRWTSKWLLMALTMFVGLLLTFTFGAWAAAAAAIGLFVLLLDRKRRWKIALSGCLIILMGASLVMFTPLSEFVVTKFSGVQVGSFAWDVLSRLKAWQFALQTWWSHFFLGVGVGNYEINSGESDWIGVGSIGSGSTPHETYFYLLASCGVVGLVSFLAVMIGAIRNNLRLKADSTLGSIALALAFAIAVNLLGGFSDDSPLTGPHASYLLWLMVGVSEAVCNLAADRASGCNLVQSRAFA